MSKVALMDVPRVDIETGKLDNGVTISHGSAAILAKLYDLSSSRLRPVFEHYLINVSTLIRNCISSFKIEKPKEILELLRTEVAQYNLYLSQYCLPDTQAAIPVNVFYYYPSYTLLPDKYLKNLTTMDRTINSVQTEVARFFYKNSEHYENLKIHVDVVGKRRLPHLEVLKAIKHLDLNADYRRTLMISHIPVDYHYSNFVPKFTLMRSHTAELTTRDKFGKMVFKYEVPFNRYTHLLFGDGKLIRPILSSQQKKKLEEVAIQRKWKFKTEHTIYEYIVKTGLAPSGYFKDSPF